MALPTVHHKNQGFVLIAVLGMIMLLSLVASFIASYAEHSLQEVIAERGRWQQQLDNHATLATVQFVLASRPRDHGGITLDDSGAASSLLFADGRPYKGIGNSAFSVQDEGALLSLLIPDETRIRHLLSKRDVPPITIASFLDQLQDYTDQDDLRRLNGATSQDYLQAELTPPPQRFMVSPGEVYNLYSSEQWPWLKEVLALFTTRSGQNVNFNTMPAAVMASLPGVSDELAQQIVQHRQHSPYVDVSDVNQRVGQLLPISSMGAPTFNTQDLRIQLWEASADCRHSQWIGLSLTPKSLLAPWEIDYVFNNTQAPACGSPQTLLVAPLAESPVAP